MAFDTGMMDALPATPNRRRTRDDDKRPQQQERASHTLISFFLACLLALFVCLFVSFFLLCRVLQTKDHQVGPNNNNYYYYNRKSGICKRLFKQEAGPSREDVLLQLPPLAPLQLGKSLLRYVKKETKKKKAFPPSVQR